jgi:DNA-directed RNA polymerase subunit RPC12/RpoP
MFMNIRCPACGRQWRVPESTLGQQVSCPGCANRFLCDPRVPAPAGPPSTAGPSTPVRVVPPARGVLLQPVPTIHYRCPRCTRPLESPAHTAGEKTNCPDCGQRLQIPQPSALPPMPASGDTRLATEEAPTARAPLPPPPTPSAAPPAEEVILTVLPVLPSAPSAPARREHCLECGRDLTQRERLPTCPDCGSLFCSAACFREHGHHAHPSHRP